MVKVKIVRYCPYYMYLVIISLSCASFGYKIEHLVSVYQARAET